MKLQMVLMCGVMAYVTCTVLRIAVWPSERWVKNPWRRWQLVAIGVVVLPIFVFLLVEELREDTARRALQAGAAFAVGGLVTAGEYLIERALAARKTPRRR